MPVVFIQSTARSCLSLPLHLPEHLCRGNIFPAFENSLVGIGKLCGDNYKVLFSKESVTVFDPSGDIVLTGWCKTDGAKLWRLSLRPGHNLPTGPLDSISTTLGAYANSAYDLPIINTLVQYFHTTAGFPVKSTWLAAIKYGNYKSWPGLTLKNATKCCPLSDET